MKEDFDPVQYKLDMVALNNYIQMEQLNERDNKNVKIALRHIIRTKLTPKQLRYIVEYFYEGKNSVEIAEIHSVNKSTVTRTIRRGLKTINDYLQYSDVRLIGNNNKEIRLKRRK